MNEVITTNHPIHNIDVYISLHPPRLSAAEFHLNPSDAVRFTRQQAVQYIVEIIYIFHTVEENMEFGDGRMEARDEFGSGRAHNELGDTRDIREYRSTAIIVALHVESPESCLLTRVDPTSDSASESSWVMF
jgi:hypothetical protein